MFRCPDEFVLNSGVTLFAGRELLSLNHRDLFRMLDVIYHFVNPRYLANVSRIRHGGLLELS
jgi:hypothetical protein